MQASEAGSQNKWTRVNAAIPASDPIAASRDIKGEALALLLQHFSRLCQVIQLQSRAIHTLFIGADSHYAAPAAYSSIASRCLIEPRYNGCNRKCESPEVPLPSGADALFWSAATCRRNGPGGRRKPATHRRTPYRTPPAAETDSHFLRPGGVIGSASQFPFQP